MPTEQNPKSQEVTKPKGKPKKPKTTKTSKKKKKEEQQPVRNWGELKELGLLSLADIQRPHQVLDNIMVTYDELIKDDKELFSICNGLSKCYFDCLDSLLGIMKQHVLSADFPTTYKEVFENPSRFQNAVFRTGKVGDGLSKVEKDSAYYDYYNIEWQYQCLAHEIHTLSNKVMIDVEMRISSKYNIGRSVEEIKKDEEEFKKFSQDVKGLLEAKQQMLDITKERIEDKQGMNHGKQ